MSVAATTTVQVECNRAGDLRWRPTGPSRISVWPRSGGAGWSELHVAADAHVSSPPSRSRDVRSFRWSYAPLRSVLRAAARVHTEPADVGVPGNHNLMR
jgi:hypothetical protein